MTIGWTKNKRLRKFLHQRFFIEHSYLLNPGSVICNKCRTREMNAAIGHSKKLTKQNPNFYNEPEYIPSTKKAKTIPRLPPSITVPITSVGGGYSQCAVCQLYGLNLVVVPTIARHNLFGGKFLILPVGTRCNRKDFLI